MFRQTRLDRASRAYLAFVFLLIVSRANDWVLAADDGGKASKPATAKAADAAPESQILRELRGEMALVGRAEPFPRDPAFDRYASVNDLATAVKQLDAKAVTDFALQLLHGQTVLDRERNGISTHEAFELARSICAETQNAASLDRLAKAAKRLDDRELLARIEESRKQATGERSSVPSPTIDLVKTDPYQFAALKAFAHEARLAKALGDGEAAQELAKRVKASPLLTEEHKNQLAPHCESAAKSTARATKLIEKLRAATRDAGMDGNWDTWYIAANGQQVHAVVQIQGDQGTYSTDNGNGYLSFTNSAAPLGGGATSVQGQWRYDDGENGFFNWLCNGYNFHGTWTFAGSGGPARQWWGHRTYDNWPGGGQPSGPSMGLQPGANPGGGDPLNDLIGASWQADNGSTCTFTSAGDTTMATPTGMRVLGRLSRGSTGQLTLNLQYDGRVVPTPVQPLNDDLVRIGSRVYRRR